jgi:hypothetical protein
MEKKLYFEPEMEVLEIDIESAILSISDTTGGGIADDGEVNTGSEGGATGDPNTDYGW